ncbi:MAG: VTT domain-containing protein [Candidatus Paceibacterota bacterium]|jgi:membrane-associated protein
MLDYLDPLFLIKALGLLFTAGLLASQGYLNIYYLLPGVFLMAVLGDTFGYTFGRKIGPKIFTREDSLFFHKKHVERAKNFYEKYGNKTIVLARFIPIVRTFAPIVAGVGQMDYRKFLTYNIFGGLAWTVLLAGGGYFLGEIVPGIEKYVTLILVLIILTSFLPAISEIWQVWRQKHSA